MSSIAFILNGLLWLAMGREAVNADVIGAISAGPTDSHIAEAISNANGELSTDQRIADTVILLQAGMSAIDRGEYVEAIKSLKEGIALLGYHYYASGMSDDTGMKLVLATIEENKSNYQVAAKMLATVLWDRLSAYKYKVTGKP